MQRQDYLKSLCLGTPAFLAACGGPSALGAPQGWNLGSGLVRLAAGLCLAPYSSLWMSSSLLISLCRTVMGVSLHITCTVFLLCEQYPEALSSKKRAMLSGLC